jgi:hypothetical protein
MLISREDNIKITARTTVDLDKKSEALLAPNIVVTPVPAIGPTRPLPFDDCINTTPINKMQTKTKNIINIEIIDNKYNRGGYSLQVKL